MASNPHIAFNFCDGRVSLAQYNYSVYNNMIKVIKLHPLLAHHTKEIAGEVINLGIYYTNYARRYAVTLHKLVKILVCDNFYESNK